MIDSPTYNRELDRAKFSIVSHTLTEVDDYVSPNDDGTYKGEFDSYVVVVYEPLKDLHSSIRTFDTLESAMSCCLDEVLKLDDRLTRLEAYNIIMNEQCYADSGTTIFYSGTYNN